MVNSDQARAESHTENSRSSNAPEQEVAVSSPETSEPIAPEPLAPPLVPAPPRLSVVERVLDNLPAWTVVAAAITLLYLVWATLDVLNVYAGDFPSVVP
jgi:small neutral amino acid transporter SnatA (MarC family)